MYGSRKKIFSSSEKSANPSYRSCRKSHHDQDTHPVLCEGGCRCTDCSNLLWDHSGPVCHGVAPSLRKCESSKSFNGMSFSMLSLSHLHKLKFHTYTETIMLLFIIWYPPSQWKADLIKPWTSSRGQRKLSEVANLWLALLQARSHWEWQIIWCGEA